MKSLNAATKAFAYFERLNQKENQKALRSREINPDYIFQSRVPTREKSSSHIAYVEAHDYEGSSDLQA
jgi:hypothetical protein